MTPDQHHELTEYSIGLAATIDAMDNNLADRELANGLLAAALVMSRKLRDLVNELAAPPATIEPDPQP